MDALTKLAIFDIDGTLGNHGEMPESVVAGLKHLQEVGYATTVCTGRGYIRAKEALGAHFETVVSPEALMVLEHGTKITDRDGKIISANYFKENEIEHIVDFTKANEEIVKLLWFNPPIASQKIQVWVLDPKHLPEETEKRGHYADVFTCSYDELKQRLLAQPLSNATARLREYIKVNNLKLHFTKSEINTLFQDGNMEFVRNIANKAQAIAYIENNFQISKDNILVAGNAVNDVEMLNLDVGKRILVGNEETLVTVMGYLTNPENATKVADPNELGLYLQKL